MTDGKRLARKRQALVTTDKVLEAIGHDEYADAADAVAQLAEHIEDLRELSNE